MRVELEFELVLEGLSFRHRPDVGSQEWLQGVLIPIGETGELFLGMFLTTETGLVRSLNLETPNPPSFDSTQQPFGQTLMAGVARRYPLVSPDYSNPGSRYSRGSSPP